MLSKFGRSQGVPRSDWIVNPYSEFRVYLKVSSQLILPRKSSNGWSEGHPHQMPEATSHGFFGHKELATLHRAPCRCLNSSAACRPNLKRVFTWRHSSLIPRSVTWDPRISGWPFSIRHGRQWHREDRYLMLIGHQKLMTTGEGQNVEWLGWRFPV